MNLVQDGSLKISGNVQRVVVEMNGIEDLIKMNMLVRNRYGKDFEMAR